MTTNNGAGGLVEKWREESNLLEKSFDPSNTIIALERRRCARELEAALQAQGDDPDGYTAYGEFRWDCDCDDRMRSEWTPVWVGRSPSLAPQPPPSDVLRRVVEALEKLVGAVRGFADGDMSPEVRARLYLSKYSGPEQATYGAMCDATDEATEALAAHKALAEGVGNV